MRKDYRAIAKIIARNARRAVSDDEEGEIVVDIDELIHDLCTYFRSDDPMFDRKKFVAACEL